MSETKPKKFVFKTKAALPNGTPVPVVATPKTAEDATKAALAIVLNHTAETFHGIVNAISEHYKLDKDEMMRVVVNHPSFKEGVVDPVLNDLGFLGLNTPAPEAPDAPQAVKPKKFVIKKK